MERYITEEIKTNGVLTIMRIRMRNKCSSVSKPRSSKSSFSLDQITGLPQQTENKEILRFIFPDREDRKFDKNVKLTFTQGIYLRRILISAAQLTLCPHSKLYVKCLVAWFLTALRVVVGCSYNLPALETDLKLQAPLSWSVETGIANWRFVWNTVILVFNNRLADSTIAIVNVNYVMKYT